MSASETKGLYTLETGDGKYQTILCEAGGFRFEVLRHEEPWRDLVGDGYVLSLIHHIQELEEQIEAMSSSVTACKDFVTKVDRGEARSTRSYNQMKSALDDLARLDREFLDEF